MSTSNDIQLISRKELCKKLTINPATLWRIEQQGGFPNKVIIGHSRVAYRLNEIEEWIVSNQLKEVNNER